MDKYLIGGIVAVLTLLAIFVGWRVYTHAQTRRIIAAKEKDQQAAMSDDGGPTG